MGLAGLARARLTACHPMKTTRLLAALLIIPLLAAGAGCASQTAEERAAKRKAAEEEYVYITVTGSNIPRRIKKSDILEGKALPKDGDGQMVDKDTFFKTLGPPGKKIDRGS
jgi:hypothetical protein